MPLVLSIDAPHTGSMHGAMDTLRATIRLGTYVFLIVSLSTSLLLVLGPVTSSLRAVFLPSLLARILSAGGA